MTKSPHHLLLVWMILTGLILFSLFITWHENYLQLLYAGDKSKISWGITLMYIVLSLHCAKRFMALSTQLNTAMEVDNLIKQTHKFDIQIKDGHVLINNNTVLPKSVIADYFKDLMTKAKNGVANKQEDKQSDNTNLIEVYESKLKKPHEIGWFLTDVMIKLGLLGTIVGFVLMLASVVNVTDFDVSAIQKILREMSSGMGTALYTTFAGLVCSILTGIQYHMLDEGADEIIEITKHLSNVYVEPHI